MVNATGAPKLILLLVTDQFRRDAFQPDITPNLYHQLALDPHATTFSNAYVSTPICTPARASLLTGKSPWNHGMLGYGYTVNCSSYPTTLPAILEEMGGYQTFSVGKNHFGWNPVGDYVGHGYNHHQVHDAMTNQPHPDQYMDYWDNLHPGVDPLSVTCDHGLTYNEWRSCPYGGPKEEEHPTPWTTRNAIRYLEGFDFDDEGDQKMFLKVSFHRPHSPYDPPARILNKRLAAHVPKRILNNTSWDQQFRNTSDMSKNDWHGDPGAAAARHSRAGYLGSCEFVDEGMGKIFDWLKANVLWDDTMILWTTDHGDMNGDHNLWRKGYPWEGSSHVNMIAKIPAGASSTKKENLEEPTTSDAIVETRDVAVTFYDYLGFLDTVKQRDPLIDGSSLVPILQGDTDHQVRDWLDLELTRQYRADIHWNAIVGKCHSSVPLPIDCGMWKYIFNVLVGTEQLFCLTTDPDEHHDLAVEEEFGLVLEFWHNTMVHLFEQQERGNEWVKRGQLVKGRPPVTFAANYPCKYAREEETTEEIVISMRD